MDVRVFAAEPGNAARRESAAAALSGGDAVAEHEFFANILRSDDLAAAVAAGDYSSVIVGPAINGVTHAAVREAGRRAILVPCLHDEPAARANRVRALFETAGGVLYHSPAERELAEAVLGLSHPVSAVLGTWIGPEVGDAARGRAVVGADRYLLVLGRKAREKNLPELFDWVRRCPRGLRVAFAGAGDFPIPDEPWAVDLGEVSEQVKRDLLAGAAALVQPSVNESLSLVVLEAMAAGVPVIGHAGCGAVAEHVRQSGAGRLARTAEEFAEAVAAVEADPALGRGGPDYIARAFRRPERMIDAVARVRRGAVRPLAATLHVAGPLAAARRRRVEWRAAFDRVIEFAVERSAPIGPTRVELRANQRLTDAASWRVEIRHFGGRPLFATGPARTTLLARVRNAAGDIIGPDIELPIPAPLHGRTLALGVELPRLPIGSYGLEAGLRTGAVEEWHGTLTTLDVTGRGPVESSRSDQVWTTPARALQTLPDGYEDVSTGRFAGLKRWLKQKLLHNFRAGYVDVLARQQSRFNRELLDGLEELTGVIDRPADADMRAVRRQLQELTRRVERLERRNATIEASR
jgi:hypothetical protein